MNDYTDLIKRLRSLYVSEGTDYVQEAAQVIEALVAERDALRDFVAALFDASDWPIGGDIDLCTFQDLAVAHGVLVEEQRTEPCGEHCHCAEYVGVDEMKGGTTCCRKVPWLISAQRKEKRDE